MSYLKLGMTNSTFGELTFPVVGGIQFNKCKLIVIIYN